MNDKHNTKGQSVKNGLTFSVYSSIETVISKNLL